MKKDKLERLKEVLHELIEAGRGDYEFRKACRRTILITTLICFFCFMLASGLYYFL